MRSFQKKLLMELFRLQRNEVTGEGRKLLSEELPDVYFLLCNWLIVFICMTESTQVNWAGHELRMGQKRNACRLLVRKPQRYRLVGRRSLREEDNNEINSRGTEF